MAPAFPEGRALLVVAATHIPEGRALLVVAPLPIPVPVGFGTMVRTVVCRSSFTFDALEGSLVARTVDAPMGTSLLAITTVAEGLIAVAAVAITVELGVLLLASLAVAAVAMTVELGILPLAAACFFPLLLGLALRLCCGESLGAASAVPFDRLVGAAFSVVLGELESI